MTGKIQYKDKVDDTTLHYNVAFKSIVFSGTSLLTKTDHLKAGIENKIFKILQEVLLEDDDP
jgi:hypothetical protein